MLPQWISDKHWSVFPFLPIIITLLVQWLSSYLAKNLDQRAEEELKSAGIPEGHARQTAIHIGQDRALVLGMYGGLLPVVGALVITVLNRPPLNPIIVTIIYGVSAVISFLVIPLTISTRPGSTNAPFPDNPDPWHQKILKKLGFDSYGSFINTLLRLITAVILFYIAYLQLSPSTVPSTPTSTPPSSSP